MHTKCWHFIGSETHWYEEKTHLNRCTASVKHHLSSEVTPITQCVGVFLHLPLTYWYHSTVISLWFFTGIYDITRALCRATLTLTEFRYMRTSSNCLKRKKQEAMHCLPGIVSVSQKCVRHTCSHSSVFNNQIDQIQIQGTAFASRASN